MCARTQVHKYKIHTLLHTTSTQHKQHKPETHKTNLPNLCPRGTARARLQPNVHTYMDKLTDALARTIIRTHLLAYTNSTRVLIHLHMRRSADALTNNTNTTGAQTYAHEHHRRTTHKDRQTDRQTPVHGRANAYAHIHANTLSCTCTNMQTHSPAHTLTNTHIQTPTYVQTCVLQTHIHTTQTTHTHLHTTHTTQTHMHIKHITQHPNTHR